MKIIAKNEDNEIIFESDQIHECELHLDGADYVKMVESRWGGEYILNNYHDCNYDITILRTVPLSYPLN